MGTTDFADHLCAATNSHDVAAIVACFSPDYVNETPCHPEMGFTGNEQVRRNWTAILGAVPDLVAEVVSEVAVGSVVWSEWEMRGTRPDGAPHLMRGVVVFTVGGGLATRARFYLEPVEQAGPDADHAVARGLGS